MAVWHRADGGERYLKYNPIVPLVKAYNDFDVMNGWRDQSSNWSDGKRISSDTMVTLGVGIASRDKERGGHESRGL